MYFAHLMVAADSNFWSMIFNAHKVIEVGGLLLLLAIIYIETGFFLGLVLPGGDYMLFAAGLFCGSQYLETPIFWLVALLILASFLGDLTGYFKGKWLGNKIFTDNKSRFFKLDYLERGKKYYNNYGLWTLLFSRFMPVIRTLVPMIAGATAFPFRRFILFDALGAIAWVGSLVPLGYFIGKAYPGVINYSVYILLLIVIIASFPVIKMIFSNKP
jgi:membrane-associated protein